MIYRKRYFLVCMIAVFFILNGCSIFKEYRILRKPEEVVIESSNKELKVGERFTYKAEWMRMDVGIITLSVEGITEVNDRKVYHIAARAQTTPIISKLYKVDDLISTYMDIEKLYPLRFEKRQREGGYMSDEYTDYIHDEKKALYHSRLNGSRKEFDIPEGVHDQLSAIYYFRMQDVKVGQSVFADVNADEKNYLLEAKVLRKGSIKINDVGEWDSFMVEPLPWFQGKVTRKAKATIWFSADEKRIPLLMVTKGIPFVGTVTITLQKIEYLDSDI